MKLKLNTEIKGEGFPILCLHGHPGNAECMSVFTNHLSGNFQTITPDLRGYGKSMTKKHFEIKDHLLDLEEILTELKIKECLILGWSFGGILGLELALKFPEKIKGIILIASSGNPWGSHPKTNIKEEIYTVICSIINKIKPGWQWNIETFGKRSLYNYLLQQHTKKAYNYLAKYAFGAYLQTSKFARRALIKALDNRYNRLEELKEIKAPCLVIAGESDRHITAQSSLETAKALPNAQFYCYPKTAHLLPWEIPEIILNDIDKWLKINI